MVDPKEKEEVTATETAENEPTAQDLSDEGTEDLESDNSDEDDV